VTCFTLGETTDSPGSHLRHLPERLSASLICERARRGGVPIQGCNENTKKPAGLAGGLELMSSRERRRSENPGTSAEI
jgi:hypothetical protein